MGRNGGEHFRVPFARTDRRAASAENSLPHKTGQYAVLCRARVSITNGHRARAGKHGRTKKWGTFLIKEGSAHDEF